MVALAYVLVGFALIIGGLAAWSKPLACIIAGACLLVAGALALPKETKR